MNSIIFELIEKYKKNSRLSSADKELFENTIFDELSKGIYNDDTEKVLYEGPAELVMKAFAVYLTSIEKGDANDYLTKFMRSDRVQENKGGQTGTRLVILFGALVECSKEQNKLMENAFISMVFFSYKKDKNEINKKVVDQLRNTIFPLFDERDRIIDLKFIEKEKVWNKARDLFFEVMLNLEKTSFGRIQKIYYWLKSSNRNMGKYTEDYVTQITLAKTEKSYEIEKKETGKTESAVNTKESTTKVNNSKVINEDNREEQEKKHVGNSETDKRVAEISDVPKKKIDLSVQEDYKKNSESNRIVMEIVNVLLAEYESQKETRQAMLILTQKVNDMQAQINKLLSREEQQRTYIQELVTEKRSLTAENTEDERKIKKLTELVEKLKCEIDDRKQFTDTVARNREKQSEEQLNKLASKLRVDYRDFCDAKDIDMTIDLGENMREQLGAVFSILEKNGIKLS